MHSLPLTRQSEASTRQSEALTRQSKALTRQSEVLTGQSEALTRQSEVLTRQSKALTRQSEALTRQSTPLITKSEPQTPFKMINTIRTSYLTILLKIYLLEKICNNTPREARNIRNEIHKPMFWYWCKKRK